MTEKLPKELIEELDGLMARLMRGNADERAQAMNRLTSLERSGRIPLSLLLDMAEESNPSVAMYAVGALGRNGGREAVAKLVALASGFRDANALMVETLVDALGETGSAEATPVLLEIIGRGGGWGRKLLGRLSRKKKEAADAEQERFRAYMLLPVVRALEKIGDPKAIDAIADLLEHRDPLIRCHVIRTFINAGARNPKLQHLAEHDPNQMVKEVAQIAVEKLGPVAEPLN